MTDADAGPGLDRVLTVPNALSILRLVFLGLFVWLLVTTDDRVAAALLLGAAGVTDFFDGYIARRFHQVSRLGAVLDPTVDRVVLVTSILSITVYGAVPIWLTAVVLGREVLVSVAVLVLAAMGARRIEVLWVGKASTFGLMVCFPLFLGGDGPGLWARVLTDLTWVVAVPALGASLYSAAAYVPEARHALAAGRTGAGTAGRDRSSRDAPGRDGPGEGSSGSVDAGAVP
jgi:cardiolipin synthase